VRLVVTGPGDFYLDTPGIPVDSDKAIYITHADKKRTAPRWPEGTYTGEVSLIHDGAVIRKSSRFVTPP
jgi:hypothetical protein